MAIPRILYDNKVTSSSSVITASSEESGFEADAKLHDRARGRRHRTRIGWTPEPLRNDALPFWTTTDGHRLAYVAPGNYSTGALNAAAVQAAMNAAGLNPVALGASLIIRGDSVELDSDGYISQWTDISGNGRHLTQATAGLRALWVANGVNNRPTGYWAGDVARGYSSAALMSTMLAATTGRSTIVLVMKLDSDASANDTFFFAGSAGHFMSSLWTGGSNFAAQVYTTADVTATKTSGSGGVNVWQHIWFSYDGTDVGAYASDADSAAIASAAQTGNVHADILASVFNLGLSTTAKMHLAELHIYPGNLSQAQRRGVVQYLEARYPAVAATDTTTAHTWTDTQTASYSSTTKKFTISTNAAELRMLAATATPALDLAAAAFVDLGYTLTDKTGAATYTGGSAAYQSRQRITVDLASALAIQAAIVLDHNAGASGGTFTLRGNDHNYWASPPVSQLLSGDGTQRSAYFSATRRWLDLLINDVQNSAGYSEIGVLFAGPYFQPPAWHTNWNPGYDDLSVNSEASDGAGHLDERPSRETDDLRWNGISNANRASFVTFRQASPVGKPFFFLFDTLNTLNIRYVSLARPLQTPHGRKWWTVLMSLREVLP